jgi:hypothetical protein
VVSGINHCARHKQHLYDPVDDAARAVAQRWGKNEVRVNAKVDDLGRELRVWSKSIRSWGVFRMKEGLSTELGSFTTEDDERLRPVAARNSKLAAHRSHMRRLRDDDEDTPAARRSARSRPTKLPREQKLAVRAQEAEIIKDGITGRKASARAAAPPQPPKPKTDASDRKRIDERLKLIRKQKGLE